jgi:hypothetical protein
LFFFFVELFFQILTSYHTVREEKCMAPELNISKPFPRTTHDTITAALHEASWVMKSLLLCNDKGECFKKSSSFWLGTLIFLYNTFYMNFSYLLYKCLENRSLKSYSTYTKGFTISTFKLSGLL